MKRLFRGIGVAAAIVIAAALQTPCVAGQASARVDVQVRYDAGTGTCRSGATIGGPPVGCGNDGGGATPPVVVVPPPPSVPPVVVTPPPVVVPTDPGGGAVPVIPPVAVTPVAPAPSTPRGTDAYGFSFVVSMMRSSALAGLLDVSAGTGTVTAWRTVSYGSWEYLELTLGW